MTWVAPIEGWVTKPLEGVTGVEVVEKVGVKFLVLSTDIRGGLEEELEEELVAALRAAWNLAALKLSLACLLWLFFLRGGCWTGRLFCWSTGVWGRGRWLASGCPRRKVSCSSACPLFTKMFSLAWPEPPDQTFTMSLTFLKRNASSDRLKGTMLHWSLSHWIKS